MNIFNKTLLFLAFFTIIPTSLWAMEEEEGDTGIPLSYYQEGQQQSFLGQVQELEAAIVGEDHERTNEIVGQLLNGTTGLEQIKSCVAIILLATNHNLIQYLCSQIVAFSENCKEQEELNEIFDVVKTVLPSLINVKHIGGLSQIATLFALNDEETRAFIQEKIDQIIADKASEGYPLEKASDSSFINYQDSDVAMTEASVQYGGGLSQVMSEAIDHWCKIGEQPTTGLDSLKLLVDLLSGIRLEHIVPSELGYLSLSTNGIMNLTKKRNRKGKRLERQIAGYPPCLQELMDNALTDVYNNNEHIKYLKRKLLESLSSLRSQDSNDEAKYKKLLERLPKVVKNLIQKEYTDSWVNAVYESESVKNILLENQDADDNFDRSLAVVDATTIAVTEPNQIHIYDLNSGKRIKLFEHQNVNHCMLASEGNLLSQSSNGIKIWDLKKDDNSCIYNIEENFTLASSILNNMILTGNSEYLILLDASNGSEIKRIKVADNAESSSLALAVWVDQDRCACVINKLDNSSIACQYLEIWNHLEQTSVRIYDEEEEENEPLQLHKIFAQNDKNFVTSDDYDFTLWDLTTGKNTTCRQKKVIGQCLNGTKIYALNQRYEIRVWDKISGTLLRRIVFGNPETLDFASSMKIVGDNLYILSRLGDRLIIVPLPYCKTFEEALDYTKKKNDQ